MIRPRKTLRRGEPSTEEKQEARIRCHERARGVCELQCSPRCYGGASIDRGHLHHEHAKRRFGWMESDRQRHVWCCPECHSWEHSGGKIIPSKHA